MSLHNLTAFPSLSSIQLNPLTHTSRLNTKHVLIAVLGLEITHPLGLLYPRVPHHSIAHVITYDVVAGFPGCEDGCCIDKHVVVYAVYFAPDGDAGGSLLVRRCVEDFVCVGC